MAAASNEDDAMSIEDPAAAAPDVNASEEPSKRAGSKSKEVTVIDGEEAGNAEPVAKAVEEDEVAITGESVAEVDADDADAGEDGDEPEEEYEVDEIKSSARQGKNGWQYLVSWLGYGPEHNSWVNEADFGSMDIVDNYWKARGGRPKGPKDGIRGGASSRRRGVSAIAADGDENAAGSSKKRKGAAAATSSKAESDMDSTAGGSRANKRARGRHGKAQNQPQEEDDAVDGVANGGQVGEYASAHTDSMDKYKDLVSWEDQVQKIETVERGANAKLVVYMIMKDGEKTAQDAPTVYKRCPGMMFEFYERHLKWRPVDK